MRKNDFAFRPPLPGFRETLGGVEGGKSKSPTGDRYSEEYFPPAQQKKSVFQYESCFKDTSWKL